MYDLRVKKRWYMYDAGEIKEESAFLMTRCVGKLASPSPLSCTHFWWRATSRFPAVSVLYVYVCLLVGAFNLTFFSLVRILCLPFFHMHRVLWRWMHFYQALQEILCPWQQQLHGEFHKNLLQGITSAPQIWIWYSHDLLLRQISMFCK